MLPLKENITIMPSNKESEKEEENNSVFPEATKEHTSPNNIYCSSDQNQFIHQKAIDKVTKVDNNDSDIHRDNVSSKVQESRSDVSSLSMIAVEYEHSDSDTERAMLDDNESENQHIAPIVETKNLHEYRSNANEETDSEDDSSSSSDSSSSTTSSSSRSRSSSISDSDDSNDKTNKSNNNRKGVDKIKKYKQEQNEFDNLPPIENLQINVPEESCNLLGEVAWMVEQFVIVKPAPDKPTLNLDTVLFLDNGKRTLGKIFDVFGQVIDPHYCMRFNSSEHIKECDVKVGMPVYYCPNSPYTSLVFVHELTKMKGCDVGNDDVSGEPPDFSDDEKEQAYYRSLQKKKNTKNNTDGSTRQTSKRMRMLNPSPNTSNSSERAWRPNHPWSKQSRNNENRSQVWGSNNQSSRSYTGIFGNSPYQSHQFNMTDPALSRTYNMYNEDHDASQSSNVPYVPPSVDYNFRNNLADANQYYQGAAEWNTQNNYMHYPPQSPHLSNSDNTNQYYQGVVRPNFWGPHQHSPFGMSPRFGQVFPPAMIQQSSIRFRFPNVQFPQMPMQSYAMQPYVTNMDASWSTSPSSPARNRKTDESKDQNCS